jgi:hypothetical protein
MVFQLISTRSTQYPGINLLIPNGVRKEFLQKLEEKPKTYKTVLPELAGTVSHYNLKHELRD